MSHTVRFDETESVRLTDNSVEVKPPDRLEFSLRGRLAASEATLAAFEGATLNPVRVTVSTGDDADVALDLTGPASLRLENVDVGVASPDAGSIPDDLDALRSSATDALGSIDSRPDVLAFTVDGVVRDASTAPLESLAADEAETRVESVTFAVGDSVASDGGSEPEVVLELSLFGYGVVVRRDGTIVVGSGGTLASIDLP